jgi:outer membrane protein assembly factor BamB
VVGKDEGQRPSSEIKILTRFRPQSDKESHIIIATTNYFADKFPEEGLPIMAAQTLNCPTCGAPLDYDGGPETTIHCPFCNSSVVVPEELRPEKPPEVVIITPSTGSGGGGLTLGIIAVVIILIIGGAVFAFLGMTRGRTDNASPVLAIESPTPEEPPTDTPEPSPTPAYANPKLSFGESGIGPGQLNDPRYLAVDGSGTLYVADYQGGRIQAFDATGKYLSQFTVGDLKTTIHGLAADHQGKVYIAAGDAPDILVYDGKTGQALGKLTSPNGGEFGEMAATANGGVDATWYEGRWGLITSLEGHRDDLVQFDSQGKVASTISSFISSQTGDLALDIYIAVDGLGRIFALSDGVVYVFSPEGKFTNRFGSVGDQPGQFKYPRAISVDGQDQVYIGDTDSVHVYTADGRFITDFPTQDSANSMVMDEQGNLWILGGGKVTQYVVQSR